MDAILSDKITDQDVKFADERINKVLNEIDLRIGEKTAKKLNNELDNLRSDYKHKHAAMRLSGKKGDMMSQKTAQYEAKIKERTDRLFKNQTKGE
jgi:actin-like ATPase involved in cell morphogenesis